MDRSLQSFDVANNASARQLDMSSSQVKKAAGVGGLIGVFIGGVIVWVCMLLMRPDPKGWCRDHMYETLTGNSGHVLPEMYGKVKEKTIWLYWNNRGTIPELALLCIESIKRNKGSFDVRLIYKDEIDKYVSRVELPFQWEKLLPAQQKDSLMNALLARYGGIALDATLILFDSFDAWWDDLVSKGALFRGFMYDKGETSVWCMMARREGLFRSATIAQVIGAGDADNSEAYKDKLSDHMSKYFAFGDRTITPIINMYNYSRGPCYPPWDGPEGTCYPPHPASPGQELGGDKLIIQDPEKGPQLGCCAGNFSCGLHRKSDYPDEWKEFETRRANGLMPFVKMFQSGGDAKKMSRSQLLAQKGSFLLSWLCLAKLPDIGCEE